MFFSVAPIGVHTGVPAKSLPLPPVPQANGTESRRTPAPRPAREKKIYVAAYDYKPNEEGDLELITVSEIFLKYL